MRTTDSSETEVSSALRTAAGLGPFFAVLHTPDGSGWQSLESLLTDPDVLEQSVQRVETSIASGITRKAVARRVAASSTQLSIVARLVSPILAAAVIGDVLVDLEPARWRWRVEPGQVMMLATTGSRGVPAGDAQDVAAALDLTLLERVIAPLVETTQCVARISPKVLWGNVSSAVAGAATVILSQRSDQAVRLEQVVAAVLALPRLRSTGGYDDGPTSRAAQFRRRSCCLVYRVPGMALCDDCVLATAGRG